jgi:hypothetical protein
VTGIEPKFIATDIVDLFLERKLPRSGRVALDRTAGADVLTEAFPGKVLYSGS